ncbi:MAG: 4-(cytidine 5'-diphospho)-2-C-methyl-D-erythritol kinase [Bacteroidales bacterium]|jgi:4-diphosphocytidyl-2-C-methyl-D-erythritol kinase|nr:4-(cytidine 5'-diphospho)-2-C-methyl-D-erythritol kinase [Bacteroidales bacterium]
MIFFPNAKINIGLNIIGKRQDGFHNIESVFMPIPLKDVLEIRENGKEKTRFFQTGISVFIKNQNDNLVMKAYYLLKKDYPLLPSLDIHLHKIIPSQAGLGGGSSDAAFTLRLINRVCSLNLTNNQLNNYALQLGSDCAFFLQEKPKYISGRGDIIKDCDIDLSGYWISLLKINEGVSTAEAYANIKSYSSDTQYKCLNDVKTWKTILKNDFEYYVFSKYPKLKIFKDFLYNKGATFVSMTGTGSCIYALSEEKLDLEEIKHYSSLFIWQQIL